MSKTGDIYLVRFHPTSGQELKKFRPAVIVNQNISKLDSRFTLICPFTTQQKPQNLHELPITNKALEKPSLLLTWYLWTIDNQRLVSKLGTLTTTNIRKLSQSIKKLLN